MIERPSDGRCHFRRAEGLAQHFVAVMEGAGHRTDGFGVS
jgi:hypothetical protein